MLRQIGLGLAATALGCGVALGQAYPARQITFVVPFAAGGPVDNGGRPFADAMRKALGTPVLVDNRPGAGGVVGMKWAMAAKPDGYTLLIGSPGPMIIAPAAGTAGIDIEKQLTAIGLISTSPQVMVASLTIKPETLSAFVAFAKSGGAALNYGSAGIGTMPHLAAEVLKAQAGIEMLHVPYRGTGTALPDLISGRLHVLFGDITTVLPLVESGRIRAYAVTSPQRSELAPKIPTTTEEGMPKLTTRNWNTLMGPAGLPAPVIEKLAEAMRAVLKDADYLAAMRKQGASPAESSREHATRFIAEERQMLEPLVKSLGLKLE